MRYPDAIHTRRPATAAATVALFAAVACAPATTSTPATPAQPAPSSAAAASATPATASPTDAAEQAAQKRAQTWLELLDHGQYAESWDAAAPLLQQSVTKDQWQKAVSGARSPLGDLGSRKLRAAEFKDSLSGAPAGKYVVVYYDSAFAQNPSTSEIVTLAATPDESWKVAGYYVK